MSSRKLAAAWSMSKVDHSCLSFYILYKVLYNHREPELWKHRKFSIRWKNFGNIFLFFFFVLLGFGFFLFSFPPLPFFFLLPFTTLKTCDLRCMCKPLLLFFYVTLPRLKRVKNYSWKFKMKNKQIGASAEVQKEISLHERQFMNFWINDFSCLQLPVFIIICDWF